MTTGRVRATTVLLVMAGRPRQWSKNLLTFLAALVYGAGLFDAFRASMAMTAAAAAVYLYNDIRDRDEDRKDPSKSRRPIASGAVSVWQAAVAASVLAVAAIAAAGPAVPAIVAYLVVNAAYSLGAKTLPLLEALLVGASFPLRAIVGAAYGDRGPSTLLLLSIWLSAIGVIAAKRQGELHERHGARKVNRHYSPELLRNVRALCFLGAVATTFTAVGPVAAAGLALASMRLHLKAGRGETARPDETVFADPLMLAGAALWAGGLFL